MSLQMVVTPGYGMFASREMTVDRFAADQDFASNIDRFNHSDSLQSDEAGELLIPALIPGAHYRYTTADRVTTDFIAQSGETYDMGQIQLEDD